MASSEEEGEIVVGCVTDFYFVDSEESPVSFFTLPLQWNENECETYSEHKLEKEKHVYLRGVADEGCREIYKEVFAWKFELSYDLPELHVLVNGNYKRWIKLQSPLKSYKDIVRSVLISVHCLHFVKKNSEEVSGDALWKHIRETFSTYEVPPSENDLVDHMQWISEAALRDKDIKNAENWLSLLTKVAGKRKALSEENGTGKKLKITVDEDSPESYDASDENMDEMFDRVCALCDDGGDILSCEGKCIRSFHPTVQSGADSCCESLCYSTEEVEAIQIFLCKNCKYQRHQCFKCGRLGSSNISSGAEVFPCVSATCGHFYHPNCVSKLVFPDDDNQAQELQKKIEGGDTFTCPAHKCSVCKLGEDKSNSQMQFAICRRCPKAYHRKCLPGNISFNRDDASGIPQRAWEDLLPKRILIYCKDHKICRNILTPRRDHLVFPEVCGEKEHHTSETLPDKAELISEMRSKPYGALTKTDEVAELRKGVNDDLKSRHFINRNEKSPAKNVSKPNFDSNNLVKNVAVPDGGKPHKLSVQKTALHFCTPSAKPSRQAELEKRIESLMKTSTSSFNLEEFYDQERRKCGHSYFPAFGVDKSITMGKVECSVKAVEAALKKLQEGGTIEDAKAVCEPGILTQMIKWKKKLGVYLSPFFHGKRYTSFGRHFTNIDKLKQVVNMLCWYVRDGDTIVDFCCGSNDFSCLMKEKLDSMGRKCSFKNYDLIQPKNDFNFEKRDWMSIRLEELPEGSNLIMGLNPPFGYHAFYANQFIEKALQFRPKLLILIVPKETESLDKKKNPYDLIWQDNRILCGKAFYLPGSIDVHEQQIEQWNLEAPPLYLWSRPDWTAYHTAVAAGQGHIINMEHAGGFRPKEISNYLMEENQDCYGDFSSVADGILI